MYLEDMVTRLILSLADPSPDVVKGAFEALSALVKRQPKEVLEKLVKPAKQTLTCVLTSLHLACRKVQTVFCQFSCMG